MYHVSHGFTTEEVCVSVQNVNVTSHKNLQEIEKEIYAAAGTLNFE